MQTLIKFCRFIHKILSGNKILTILTIIKGHNRVAYLRKLTRNNPNVDLANVNANARFGIIPSIRSQDVERK